MQLQKLLAPHVGSAAVAGGFARDMALGFSPNDIDIAVFGPHRHDVDHHIAIGLQDLGYYQTEQTETYGEEDVYDHITQYSHALYPDVDVLVYHGRIESIIDVVKTFDFNINQFYLEPTRHAPVFLGHYYGTLIEQPNARVNTLRASRMRDKAARAGWAYPAKLDDLP